MALIIGVFEKKNSKTPIKFWKKISKTVDFLKPYCFFKKNPIGIQRGKWN